MGRDPIKEKGGIHLYAFVTNNPINHWDYLGHELNGTWRSNFAETFNPYTGANNGHGSSIITQTYQDAITGGDASFGGASDTSGLALAAAREAGEQNASASVAAAAQAAQRNASIAGVVNWVNSGIAAIGDSSGAAGGVSIGEIVNLGPVGSVTSDPTNVTQAGKQYDPTDEQVAAGAGAAYDANHAPNTSPQALLGAVANNMQTTGMANTLQVGAFVGNLAGVPYVIAGAAYIGPPAFEAGGEIVAEGITATKAAATIAGVAVAAQGAQVASYLDSGNWLTQEPAIQQIVDGSQSLEDATAMELAAWEQALAAARASQPANNPPQ